MQIDCSSRNQNYWIYHFEIPHHEILRSLWFLSSKITMSLVTGHISPFPYFSFWGERTYNCLMMWKPISHFCLLLLKELKYINMKSNAQMKPRLKNKLLLFYKMGNWNNFSLFFVKGGEWAILPEYSMYDSC